MKKFYKCPKCKHKNEFNVWVFAHRDIPITHLCKCGNINYLCYGELERKKSNDSKTK